MSQYITSFPISREMALNIYISYSSKMYQLIDVIEDNTPKPFEIKKKRNFLSLSYKHC